MSTISGSRTAAQPMTRQPWTARLVADLKRWWMTYLIWRTEQAAVEQLQAMSDRELRDIGLARSEITGAVLMRERRRTLRSC